MYCINKNHKRFKDLVKRYGDEVFAEMVVRKITKIKNLPEGEFHLPTISEAKEYIKIQNADKLKRIDTMLRYNPNMPLRGILDGLQGVVTTLEDRFYIIKGPSGSLLQQAISDAEIYQPNLGIMKIMENVYPDIFKLKNLEGRKNLTEVLITPKEERYSQNTDPYKPSTTESETDDYFQNRIKEENNRGVDYNSSDEDTYYNIENNQKYTDTSIRNKYFFDEPIEGFLKSSVVLERISNSGHLLNKLARHLTPYLERINNPTIQLSKDVSGYAGNYSLATNHIIINENARFRGKGAESTIIHEILHGITSEALINNSELRNKLSDILNYVTPYFEKYNKDDKTGTYAISDVDEFLVALFTDSNFIKELSNIPALNKEKVSILKEVFDYILQILNIKEFDNIYEEAFSVATSIIEYASNNADEMYENNKELFFYQLEAESYDINKEYSSFTNAEEKVLFLDSVIKKELTGNGTIGKYFNFLHDKNKTTVDIYGGQITGIPDESAESTIGLLGTDAKERYNLGELQIDNLAIDKGDTDRDDENIRKGRVGFKEEVPLGRLSGSELSESVQQGRSREGDNQNKPKDERIRNREFGSDKLYMARFYSKENKIEIALGDISISVFDEFAEKDIDLLNTLRFLLIEELIHSDTINRYPNSESQGYDIFKDWVDYIDEIRSIYLGNLSNLQSVGLEGIRMQIQNKLFDRITEDYSNKDYPKEALSTIIDVGIPSSDNIKNEIIKDLDRINKDTILTSPELPTINICN